MALPKIRANLHACLSVYLHTEIHKDTRTLRKFLPAMCQTCSSSLGEEVVSASLVCPLFSSFLQTPRESDSSSVKEDANSFLLRSSSFLFLLFSVRPSS